MSTRFPAASKALRDRKAGKVSPGPPVHRAGADANVLVDLPRLHGIATGLFVDKELAGRERDSMRGTPYTRRRAAIEISLINAFKDGSLDWHFARQNGTISCDGDGRFWKSNGEDMTAVKGISADFPTPPYQESSNSADTAGRRELDVKVAAAKASEGEESDPAKRVTPSGRPFVGPQRIG